MRFAFALALVVGCTGVQAQSLEPGEWEFVSEIATPGLPRPQPSGYRACLSREQAKDPLHWGRGARLPSDCRVTTMKLGPDTASWELECPSSGLTGAGKARFFSGSMESEMQLAGGVRSKTKGRRLGPCKP